MTAACPLEKHIILSIFFQKKRTFGVCIGSGELLSSVINVASMVNDACAL